MLQLPPHLLTIPENGEKIVSSELILKNVGVAWHGRLFKVKYFVGSLGGNVLLKSTCVRT